MQYKYNTFYRHLEGRIGFNTVNPFLSAGKDYPVHNAMGKGGQREGAEASVKKQYTLTPKS